jgi:hypothetical protein
MIGRVTLPWMLTALTFMLVAACLGAIVVSVRKAPAVALAVFGCLAVGVGAFAVSSARGPRGVPQDVAVWASVGLFAMGAVGLLVTRGRPPSRGLRRAAVAVAATAPAAGALLGASLAAACPLYGTGRTYCHHSFDMLGGWVAGVGGLFMIDLFAIATVLAVSAAQARSADEEGAGSATASGPPGR